MAFMDHIHALNDRGDLTGWLPFRAGGIEAGLIEPAFAALLGGAGGAFQLADGAVILDPALKSFAERSAEAEAVLRALYEIGQIRAWKDEPYPVLLNWGDDPALTVERASAPYLGIRAFGVHVVGYVDKPDGLHLWIARRSLDRTTAPGKFDSIVAGGQPYGLTLMENVIKESAEEAGMDAALAGTAKPAGTVSYTQRVADGLKRDTLFLFDIAVPADFLPTCADGENEGYELWPAEEVAARIRDTDDFKFNVNLVMIDFLIRHGVINAENEPDYLRLAASLRTLDRVV